VTNDSRSIVYPSLHLMNMSLSDNVQRRELAFGYIYEVKYPAIYYDVEQLEERMGTIFYSCISCLP
jgi:hypothetical protein